jgi:RTA1 like protein
LQPTDKINKTCSYYAAIMAMTLNGTAIEPSKCTVDTCSLEYAKIEYLPSLGANVTYLACFGIILVCQLGLGIRHRIWGFLAGMSGGLALEILGYLGRVLMHYNPFKLNSFVLYVHTSSLLAPTNCLNLCPFLSFFLSFFFFWRFS